MKAIITFHSIDNSGSVLSYSPEMFAGLLEALNHSEIPVLDLEQLLKNDTQKGISLTFDDGMRSLYTSALPVLKDFKVPAHLYLATGSVGKTNRWPTQPDDAPDFDMLSWDEIEALHDVGVIIDSHTHNHPDMRALNIDEIQQECDTADELIEKRLGRRPQYFAYPYGYKNTTVSDFVRDRYKATVTTKLKTLGPDEDTANLPRIDSYYLQDRWLQNHLDSFIGKAYFSLRSVLRTIRGTQ